MISKKELWIVAAISAVFSTGAAPQKTITKTFNFKVPQIIEQADNTCRVAQENTIPNNIPGEPILPQFGASFNLPDGYEVEAVTLLRGKTQPIALTSQVEWGQPFFKPGDPPLFCAPDPLIYLSHELYPANNALQWRCDPTDGSTLFSLSFAPLQYNPLATRLLCSASVTAHITLTEKPRAAIDPIQGLDLAASLLNPEERCDYLIISTSNLIARAAPPFDFNALLTTREQSGFITKLLPVEWIDDHYPGVDQPARIRRFLQDAHATWGLQYLLIAGTHQMIPARKLYIFVQSFLTTYTDEIPADHIYYGCLGGSYDGNNNGRYGEYNDGDGGGDVDLTAEILVGRFPVENEVELAHMVRKTLQHETAAKEELFRNGFISEKVNFGTVIYGEPYMEEIRNGSTTFNKVNLGYTNSPYKNDFITTNNLHDSDDYLFSKADSLDYLANNRYSINHVGHGARYQCLKLNVYNAGDYAALAALQNPFPYFIYSQACESGAFDTPDCFAEQIVTVSNAAAAVVMNSRNGWATANSLSGYSQFFHRYFWDGAFRGSATTYGQLNEYARRKNLSSVPAHTGSLWRWVYYELNLLGDPAMPVLPALLNVPPIISHTPLLNTFNTESNYAVRCHLNPVGIFDPESVFLTWSSSALAGVVHSQRMERAIGNLYQGALPPQPVDTLLQYTISANNRAGYQSASPETGSHPFHVTEELSFNVIGSPFDIGVCEPDYGSHSSASGLVIKAACADLSYVNERLRYVNQGFVGTGSVPPSSTNQTVSFQIDMNSMLIWRWQKQHRVLVNSSLGMPSESVYWVNSAATLIVPPAERFLQDAESNQWAFAGWELDNARSPALPAKSVLQHPDLNVTTHHELTAIYIPADQDLDGNQIADWWELQYFGAIGQDIFADHDNDGYDLYQEFADLSDPRDSQSFPAPPRIIHTPLQEIQNRPGPFESSALITDTHRVTNAAVCWKIRSGELMRTPLNLTSNHVYWAQIA
ncbi:MAG: C25 family cysteine peptidase, partial [Kiritimatiellae bacterium]|nr:C25 family cysteine peptidase [Kiritimatiellia bacterium]